MIESIPLTDGIYALVGVSGVNYSNLDVEKFKQNALDLRIDLINLMPAGYMKMLDVKNNLFYTPCVGNLILTHYKNRSEIFKEGSSAKLVANFMKTKIVGRLMESRYFLDKAKEIIDNHVIENFKDW